MGCHGGQHEDGELMAVGWSASWRRLCCAQPLVLLRFTSSGSHRKHPHTSLPVPASTLVLAWQIRLEPPLPQLCSQPGADAAKYASLEKQLMRLQRAAVVMGRGQATCLAALRHSGGGPGGAAAAERLQGALTQVTSLAAAACAGASGALDHMPALAPCAGPALRWRPLPAAAWTGARAALCAEAALLAGKYKQAYEQQGLEFALSLGIGEVRGLCLRPFTGKPAYSKCRVGGLRVWQEALRI